MRTFGAPLFVAKLGASSVAGAAAAEAGGNRGAIDRNFIAAFALPPPPLESARVKNPEVASSSAAASLKVARLAAHASLALALISSSPAQAGAAVDVARGSKLFSAECAVCHPDGRNKMNSLKTLQKEALVTYQSLESEQLTKYVSAQLPHTFLKFPTITTTQDYDDVIAYVLDQAINNKWKQ
jgi:cytochrome c6